MFSLSNLIIRTEIYPNEIVKLIKDNMALVFAKLINLLSSCNRWVELWFDYCITIAAKIGHAVVDLKLEVECEPVLILYQTSEKKL